MTHSTKMQLWRVIVHAVSGLLVLLPAFLVWFQFAALSNLDQANGGSGNFHAVLVPFGAIVFLGVLGFSVYSRDMNISRDIFLVGYSLYVALLFSWIGSGNFIHQWKTFGAFFALKNNMQEFLYLLPVLYFSIDRIIYMWPKKD